MRFDVAIEEIIAELRRQNLKQPTLIGYRSAIAELAARLRNDGIEEVGRVGRHHIEAHQARLSTKKLKQRTVAQRMQAIRRFFAYLIESGHLVMDPTDGVVPLAHIHSLPRRRVTEREMRQLMTMPKVGTPHGLRDRALLELLYGTAMRIGELLSLELGDLDLDRGLVHIRDGKGGRDRVVPMGTEARRWLDDYLAQSRPQWTPRRRDEMHVFLTIRGTAMRTGNVHNMLRSYCKRARITKIYPHAIRHAVATQMLARGADLRVIKKLLGHRRLDTTQIYTRVVPEEVKATHARTHPLEVER